MSDGYRQQGRYTRWEDGADDYGPERYAGRSSRRPTSGRSGYEGEGRYSQRRVTVERDDAYSRNGSAGSRYGGSSGFYARQGPASRQRAAGAQSGYSQRGSRLQAPVSASRGRRSQTPRSSYAPSSGYGARAASAQGSVWVRRVVAIVAVIVVVVVLVNVIGCAARALSGGGEAGSSAAASQAQAASSAAVTTQVAQTAGQNMPDSAVDDPWVPSGKFTTGDAELDAMVKEFCDSNSNSSLSAADNAFNVYCAVVWGDYIERDDNQEPRGTSWDIEYAKQYIAEGGGNCYNYAAFNEYVLKYFGYSDATAEPCIVLRQSGDYGDHGLVFVTNIEDGRKCLCDSAFGANGWMLDNDTYTMQIRDIGQDPSEFTIAPFEDVSVAPWK